MAMSDTSKRYVISTLITFAAGFLVVVTPEVQQLSPESIADGALLGIFLAGVRAGVKGVVESFIFKGN